MSMYPGYNPSGMGGYEDLWKSLTGDSTDALKTNIPSGSEGVYQSILGGDGSAASGLSDAMPFVGTGLGLANSLASGQMMKHPLTTAGGLAGGLGGTLGGAALGTAIFPGVGTAIGAALGSVLGGKAGQLPGKLGGK
jgi:hypothetical protein